MKSFCNDRTLSATILGQAGAKASWVLPAEIPIGFIYHHQDQAHEHAVMMATPSDLEDFALGFSLAEGVIHHAGELDNIEIRRQEFGVELHIQIPKNRLHKLQMHQQRRAHRGRAGCGICGVDNLSDALRPLPKLPVNGYKPDIIAIKTAIKSLPDQQPMRATNHTVHGAAWANFDGRLELVREDIGRHNALDKMIGAHAKTAGVKNGFALLSSRCTYELVQKCAMAGFAHLVCLAAPTLNAVGTAKRANLGLYIFERKTTQVLRFTQQEPA